MKRLGRGPFCFALIVFAAFYLGAAEYDLIIRNGQVIDGSGNPWFRGDVAIQSDRIVKVGRMTAEAERVIDAAGLVVAPGFIDMHSHSDWVLFEDGNAQSKIRQGVTTEVIGESSSAGPFKGKLAPRTVAQPDEILELRTLGDYLSAIARAGIAVNVASYVGQGQIRECVMGNSFATPTTAELHEMKALVAEAMADGAFGLSSALMMPPSSLATTDELIELCKVVHEHNGIYSTHTRDEGLGVFDSVKEAIAIGERANVPVDIIHLKIADEKLWGRMSEVVALIEQARRRGVNVQANVYPYTRGNNDLVSIIPPRAHEGGRANLLARLKDASQRPRLKHDIIHGVAGWIVIFDEKRIIDRATYDEPFRYPEGVEYVIVNGQLVVDKGTHTGTRPGRALRHER
jgi:N-acyl-D-aspartate/D-glutamate deacylase